MFFTLLLFVTAVAAQATAFAHASCGNGVNPPCGAYNKMPVAAVPIVSHMPVYAPTCDTNWTTILVTVLFTLLLSSVVLLLFCCCGAGLLINLKSYIVHYAWYKRCFDARRPTHVILI